MPGMDHYKNDHGISISALLVSERGASPLQTVSSVPEQASQPQQPPLIATAAAVAPRTSFLTSAGQSMDTITGSSAEVDVDIQVGEDLEEQDAVTLIGPIIHDFSLPTAPTRMEEGARDKTSTLGRGAAIPTGDTPERTNIGILDGDADHVSTGAAAKESPPKTKMPGPSTLDNWIPVSIQPSSSRITTSQLPLDGGSLPSNGGSSSYPNRGNTTVPYKGIMPSEDEEESTIAQSSRMANLRNLQSLERVLCESIATEPTPPPRSPNACGSALSSHNDSPQPHPSRPSFSRTENASPLQRNGFALSPPQYPPVRNTQRGGEIQNWKRDADAPASSDLAMSVPSEPHTSLLDDNDKINREPDSDISSKVPMTLLPERRDPLSDGGDILHQKGSADTPPNISMAVLPETDAPFSNDFGLTAQAENQNISSMSFQRSSPLPLALESNATLSPPDALSYNFTKAKPEAASNSHTTTPLENGSNDYETGHPPNFYAPESSPFLVLSPFLGNVTGQTSQAQLQNIAVTEQDYLIASAEVESSIVPDDDAQTPRIVDDDDLDGGYMSDTRSTTSSTSIESSMRQHMYENGRRYHRFREGRYNFPNDDVEQEREDMKHTMVKMLCSHQLHFAPIGDAPQRVLDIGTGTGIWAIEMGEKYPSADVLGVDLSPIQPDWVPPNVRFMIDDIESPWLWPRNSFDYVHSRHIVMAVKDWMQLCRRAYEHIKPGGWVEFQEVHHAPFSADGSISVTHPIVKYWEYVREGLGNLGIDLWATANGRLAENLREAGFANVTERVLHVPIGTWPKNKVLKTVGLYWRTILLDGVQGIALGPLTRGLRWSREQVEMFLIDVRREYTDNTALMYMPMHVVYGQKPLNGI